MPRFRQSLEEAYAEGATVLEGRRPVAAKREGWATGIPLGGSDENNTGYNSLTDTPDRQTYLSQLLQAYLMCPWASACVDVIARTCTAGGLECTPVTHAFSASDQPSPPPGVTKVQKLLQYVNPHEDIRQLMRGVITDLEIFGDSFTEVVWVMNEPVALYPLDPTTITVCADEHGTVTGYVQITSTNRRAEFKPREVIHVKFDTPGDALYGTSPTQKNIVSIITWLFSAGLIKDTMKKGDPPRLWVDWPLSLPDSEVRRFQQQHAIRNLGSKNIGNVFETKGNAKVGELGINQTTHWQDIKQQSRDEIISGYGCYPSKVGVVESGNIGGGTGTSQDKGFRVNTCGPLQEIVLEKFSFALMYQAFNITDWVLKFGVVDWRDDQVIEEIRDLRIRNGAWTLNRARADIGEPPVSGGDDAILVDRQNMVLWSDLKQLSAANLEAVVAGTQTKNAMQSGDTSGPASKPSTPTPTQKSTGSGSLSGAPKPPKATA